MAATAACALAALAQAASPRPEFVRVDAAGKLAYTPDARGHRIPDFSSCGYRGGGVAIPDAPVRVVVPPAQGDNGTAIQAAIDYVGTLPPDPSGLRGAVLLLAGRHVVSGALRIHSSGIVVRGQGSERAGTRLVATGTDRRALIQIAGRRGNRASGHPAETIADRYLPIGATRLRLDRPDAVRVGETVIIEHPSTAVWIAALGMDTFPPGEQGFWLKWRPGTMDVHLERTVRAVEGAEIVLDAPLVMPFDASLGKARVYKDGGSRWVAEVGVENLRCESEFDRDNPRDEQHAWDAIALEDAENCWVRQVTAAHFAGSAVRVGDGCKAVTVEDCASVEPVSELGGYRRHTFFTGGQRTLFQRCRADHGRHDFAVGALAAGPNAFVVCEATSAHDFSGPIESWATGVLYDNVTLDGGGLALTNRESNAHGAGWSAAGCVLWQCTAPGITCRNPPGAANWAIGCWGQFFGDGHWQMANERVEPESLYRAQLAERLGSQAVANLKRRAIIAEPGNAPAIAAIPRPAPAPQAAPKKPLTVHNGWLVCDGALLIGGRIGTAWWQGSLLPARVGEFEAGVTRFVPGRTGPGFTDDLGELTDRMLASGTAALEHHWGLWYDRRRDDHQMVRRPDGDVWPPFYEQPWARSGRGQAWDGLSQYDLTAFNPWYFDRLDQFAGLCDRKGLVLLHQAYFQHNVLEAGAHWADFPWRPANCLQPTGFREPPPYVNKKRIFMADAFYDVSHPLRRELHRLYMRKCLDTLGAHTNVVYLTGEEYTGPLGFMQLWLDTVAEWERETGKRVIVGLSATKDVQDAILADPKRAAQVSVIELKYWWYARDGSLYAPAGGQSVAPRQQLRAWKGAKGRSDEQTGRQVREYRERYPGKAILCGDAKANPWVVLAAGGSMPNLPQGTDRRLLAALPRMIPFGANGPQWALADKGRDYLVVAPAAGPVHVDLSAVEGPFVARAIDPRSGQAVGSSRRVQGGKIVKLHAAESGLTVLWLSRDTSQSP